MTKKIIFSILLLGFTVFSYADEERIVGLEPENTTVVNEELRALDIDNQIQADGKLDLQSKKIENLATPTASTDATTKAYVDTTRTVAQGGTGATSLTDGGVLLGSGTGAITAMAVLADGEMIVGDGTTDPVAKSGATLRTSIGVAIGTNVQAYDAQLDDLADGKLDGASTVDTSALTGTTYLPDATVDTTALKTALSEVTSASGATNNLTLTGGSYGFYPQIYNSNTASDGYVDIKVNAGTWPGSYTTNIGVSQTGGTAYMQVRYVTASSEDYWLWILVDKNTKDILAMSGAPDHCAYGNSNDFEKESHPFRDYDPNTQDIILIEKEQAKAIQQEAKNKGFSVLEFIDRDYKIDFTEIYPYVPIHSGKFSPDKQPVLVESIPEYIQVRKLTYMTDKDKSDKKKKQDDKKIIFEAEKILKENKIKVIQEKLKLTNEEMELIRGIR